MQGGIRPADLAVGDDPGEHRQSGSIGSRLIGEDDGRRSIGDLRRIAGRNRPISTEGRAELAEGVHRGLATDSFIFAHFERITVAPRDQNRCDLIDQESVVGCLRRPAMALNRPLILFFAPDSECLVLHVGRLAHRAVVEGTPQAVVGH